MIVVFVQTVPWIFVLLRLLIVQHVHLSRSPDVCWWVIGQDGAFPILHQPYAEVYLPATPWSLPSGPGPHSGHWLHCSTKASQDTCSAPGLGPALQAAAPVLGVVLHSLPPAFLFCILPAMIFCQVLKHSLNGQPHHCRGVSCQVRLSPCANHCSRNLLSIILQHRTNEQNIWQTEPSLCAPRFSPSNQDYPFPPKHMRHLRFTNQSF